MEKFNNRRINLHVTKTNAIKKVTAIIQLVLLQRLHLPKYLIK